MAAIGTLVATALSQDSSVADEANGFYRDRYWTRQSFIVPTGDGSNGEAPMLQQTEIQNRSYSSASFKYTDSTLGGNMCINPPPQFTPYADIRAPGMLPGRQDVGISYSPAPHGQGRYYSEAIDDSSQVVHLRFGVPSYNSLTQFFIGFYNSDASTAARTGRLTSSFLTKFLKTGAKLAVIAVFPIVLIPMIFIAMGTAWRFLMKVPSSKFYYLKPTMPMYWHIVQSMVNQFAVNKKIISYTQPEQFEQFVNEKVRFDKATKTIFHQIFPEMEEDGRIDIYKIANRAKRLEMRHRAELFKQLKKEGDAGWYGKVKKVYSEGGGLQKASPSETVPFSLKTFWEKWIASDDLAKGESESAIEKDIRKETNIDKMDAKAALEKLKNNKYKASADDSFFKYFEASAADGSEWASFRVDYSGPATESFSSSTAPSSLAQKLNSATSSARDLKMNLAGGNIDSFGIVKSILDGVGSIVSTVADTLNISGLAAFAGNAFVDIPDHWESSSASMNKTSYTMTLISPYGNPVSQLMFIYVPLFMLLAGALPLATGKQSYQSPFLCEIFDRGRCITRLGVIDSLTITRGTSHLGFNKDGEAMAIEVSFTVKDLSSVVSIPIQQAISALPLSGIFDGDNAYTDYLMILSGTTLQDANDRLPILRRQIDTALSDLKMYKSAGLWAMDLGSMLPGKIMSALLSGTNKR